MNKALVTTSKYLEAAQASAYARWFKRVQQMPGANRLFRRIASSSDLEQLKDYLVEVKYALVFAGLEFAVEIEPLGRKGPDLLIERDDHQALVEITRFRLVHPGPPFLDPDDPTTYLPVYGDPGRDIRKALAKITDKLAQVEGKESLIALWNDDGDLDEWEVGAAVSQLRRDAAARVVALPAGLRSVVYGDKWVDSFFCFPLRSGDAPHQHALQRELESTTAARLVERALA
jgi:hypothetical protein